MKVYVLSANTQYDGCWPVGVYKSEDAVIDALREAEAKLRQPDAPYVDYYDYDEFEIKE